MTKRDNNTKEYMNNLSPDLPKGNKVCAAEGIGLVRGRDPRRPRRWLYGQSAARQQAQAG